MKVTEANKSLEAKLDAQYSSLKWVAGSVGLLIAAISAAGAFANIFK